MRSERDPLDLGDALARLAAEAGPSPALRARVLADAAMIAAERSPAPARNRSAIADRSQWARIGKGLFSGRARWTVGATATIGLTVAIALGYSLIGGGPVRDGLADDAILSQFSPLDRLEREVIATLDADLLDPDMPL